MSNMIRHTAPARQEIPSVTVLICQRKTPDVTKLCLESLLRWYPTIKVLIVDGDSKDESSVYLAMKQALHPNIRVHTLTIDRHSHGEIMDYALRELIDTRYVVLMDSDVITLTNGWVEEMIAWLGTDNAYAIGTLMTQGIKAEGCGPADSEEDQVRYAHPSLSMINREIYLTLEPFKDHGAPCITNMVDAKEKGYVVMDYDVERVSLHLSGSSWTAPRTVWWHDNDVMVRPMLSIIGGHSDYQGNDIEVIPIDRTPKRWDSIITWSLDVVEVYDVEMFNIRFNVRGEYVVMGPVTQEAIELWRECVVSITGDDMYLLGHRFIRRQEWQRRIVSKGGTR